MLSRFQLAQVDASAGQHKRHSFTTQIVKESTVEKNCKCDRCRRFDDDLSSFEEEPGVTIARHAAMHPIDVLVDTILLRGIGSFAELSSVG